MTTPLDTATRDLLARTSSATLTTQLFKRGLRNVCIHGVRALNPGAGMLIGPAFTLRNIPAREDLDHLGVFENPEHPQRKAIETAPAGSVLVMDCRGETRAASGGAILMTRLMVRGVSGVVTDGGLRDTPDIARLQLPVYCAAAAAPLNLAHHHAVDLNVPIACGGVAVYPGDVLVGDAEAVVVLPRHLVAEVAADAAEQEHLERFITQEVAAGAALPGTYPPSAATRARYEEWKRRQEGG